MGRACAVGLFGGAAVIAVAGAALSQPSPPGPGAVGEVAGHVPAQSAQASAAPVRPPAPQTDALYAAAGRWWAPGQAGVLGQEAAYANPYGELTIRMASGPVEAKGHPFFEPLGANGRSCATCHQPSDGMSVSADTIRQRWRETDGRDPLFAAVDGSNCPSLPQADPASHSLLLDRGLFRVFLPWPPKAKDGSMIRPEFTIEVVRDPTGCNTDPKYGLHSANPMVSVYRRPRPVANLKYVVGPDRGPGSGGLFIAKNGLPAAMNPETGRPVSMQIMSDAREPTLKTQAVEAAITHLQTGGRPTEAQLKQIVDFEMQVYAAQTDSRTGGTLVGPGGPPALGPRNLETASNGVLGDYLDNPVFKSFDMWKVPVAGETAAQRAFRESVARGADVFFLRPFWISKVMHLNTVGMGSPTKRTCATCHNMQMTGMDLSNGWMDLGTTNLPTAMDPYLSPYSGAKPELPLFKITCDKSVPPHPFYGRVIYTQDPGRALISGKCNDVGAIVMQQVRGLAARAPYFSNGSAKSLRELVDFYDRRFDIKYSDQEKQDLINFLSVL
ncbi:MAG: hypothetical protein ACXWK1_00195 [Caulobacteraceae bacterium]